MKETRTKYSLSVKVDDKQKAESNSNSAVRDAFQAGCSDVVGERGTTSARCSR